MLQHIPFPALPAPPSWYPGHMTQFLRQLPVLLRRTDVVLELRDSRLPLTSINRNFEGILRKWQRERFVPSAINPNLGVEGSLKEPLTTGSVCERIVVFNKRDLVAEWGIEAPELNVLVVGMPNVGKSTLLNALRAMGIPGPTPKALRTSAQPGMTRAISTRLKLSLDPLVYSYDSPGVMLPFLGNGERGAERGIKLALIAGIKESLHDTEALASYLLYRLNVLDPISPSYLSILPPGTSPLVDIHEFLDVLARRLGMLKRGGVVDTHRAAQWFIKWWRSEGGILAASTPLVTAAPEDGTVLTTHRRGWGFDLEWSVDQAEIPHYDEEAIQRKMEGCIDAFESEAAEEEEEGGKVSSTQVKKKARKELLEKRAAKTAARLARHRR
ncbi:hypothetical protein EIP86_002666 [Pleurotus ostreatoroseus]|nr:hypothetical protein EIP86_002666 [Pleurotus ostreatoroseus]